MENKKEYFKKSIKDFENSKQDVKDYMDFIFASHNVLKQGSGLLWDEIENILTCTLKQKL